MPPKFKISKGSVSIPPELRARGHERARQLGISFSKLITLLLQNELRAPEKPFTILIEVKRADLE